MTEKSYPILPRQVREGLSQKLTLKMRIQNRKEWALWWVLREPHKGIDERYLYVGGWREGAGNGDRKRRQDLIRMESMCED